MNLRWSAARARESEALGRVLDALDGRGDQTELRIGQDDKRLDRHGIEVIRRPASVNRTRRRGNIRRIRGLDRSFTF